VICMWYMFCGSWGVFADVFHAFCCYLRTLKNRIQSSPEAAQKASSIPLLLCHGKADDVVLYKHGERSADALKANGFSNVLFKSYNSLGHYTVPEEMEEVCKWLTANLELGTSSS